MAYASHDFPLRVRLTDLADWVRMKRATFQAERERMKAYNSLYGELSRMSDRDLADIGIGRGEIAEIAAQHAYG